MIRRVLGVAALLVLMSPSRGSAQKARLRPVEEWCLPAPTDGNSPSIWVDRRLHLFTSVGATQRINTADSQFSEWETREVEFTNLRDYTVWIEAAWVDEDRTIFGWYSDNIEAKSTAWCAT